MRTVLEPITKVTLNLYSRDVEWFKERYPTGYTEKIREVIRQYIAITASYEHDEEL